MDRRVLILGLVLGLASAGYPALSAPQGVPVTRVYTWDVTAAACPFAEGGVCLAYDGMIPGPTLDVNLGDTIVVTLVNRIAETLPPGAPAHLATAPVSWHSHGMSVAYLSDGVGESSAAPGGTYTYTARAAFAGTWHYHDHVIGFDGDEGSHRGLYGSIVVRNGAEPRADHVLDLHMLDDGANGGRGLDAAVGAGESFEIVVVGLENIGWTVRLRDPADALVDEVAAWPGISERMRVNASIPGVYRWSATGLGTQSGEVIVS